MMVKGYRVFRFVVLVVGIFLLIVFARIARGEPRQGGEQDTAHWKIIIDNHGLTITLKDGLVASGYLYSSAKDLYGGILTDEESKTTQNFVYRWNGKEFQRKFPLPGVAEKLNAVRKIAQYLPELKGKVTEEQYRFIEFLLDRYCSDQ